MTSEAKPIEQYLGLTLQPMMLGAHKREDIQRNIQHIAEIAYAAVNVNSIELPVRLLAIPEGALQGFTDEIYDWSHIDYVERMALEIPGKETEPLSDLARQLNTYIIAQAKAIHSEIPERFFNCAFIIDPEGEVIHKHYKMQVFAREHSTLPHDVWDQWIEINGSGLDAFFPVADTDIGRIGCIICMEGTYPETARGLAMNGAEIIYRPSYPEPYVSNGLWEVQNRARALDNTCYVVAPNAAGYAPSETSPFPIDMFGGQSMIVDYQGRILTNHASGGTASWAGAVIDIEALRQYRARAMWGNWLKDLRTEQFRMIYEEPIYEKNRCIAEPPLKHAENDEVVRAATERMFERGIWKKPAYMSGP